MKHLLHVLKQLALGIIVVPLAVLLLVGAVPVLGVLGIRAALALRSFRRREAGRLYLVCSPRRGWHDFLVNNLIPALPADVCVLWSKRSRDVPPTPEFAHFVRAGIRSVARPYLVLVTRERLIHRSLNGALQTLKARPARSERTRVACGQVVSEAVRELEGRHMQEDEVCLP